MQLKDFFYLALFFVDSSQDLLDRVNFSPSLYAVMKPQKINDHGVRGKASCLLKQEVGITSP